MNAVVTAGGSIDGRYAALSGTRLKALAPVRGRTMLERTLDAVRGIGAKRVAVVGNDTIRAAVSGRVERVIDDTGTGAGNILAALAAWREENQPLLYLTCDMPYVTARSLEAFLDAVPPQTLAMPLCEMTDFERRFPHAPPFGITLAGERVANGGAFFIPPDAIDGIASLATALFDARKAPWRMATIAGPQLFVKFLTKRLSVAALEARARTLLRLDVAAVRHAPPELAFDADTADEYAYALTHE